MTDDINIKFNKDFSEKSIDLCSSVHSFNSNENSLFSDKETDYLKTYENTREKTDDNFLTIQNSNNKNFINKNEKDSIIKQNNDNNNNNIDINVIINKSEKMKKIYDLINQPLTHRDLSKKLDFNYKNKDLFEIEKYKFISNKEKKNIYNSDYKQISVNHKFHSNKNNMNKFIKNRNLYSDYLMNNKKIIQPSNTVELFKKSSYSHINYNNDNNNNLNKKFFSSKLNNISNIFKNNELFPKKVNNNHKLFNYNNLYKTKLQKNTLANYYLEKLNNWDN